VPEQAPVVSVENHDGKRDREAVQAGLLVLGATLANLSTIAVTLIVVRLLGKSDVGTLLGLTFVYETLALLLTSGFPQTLMYYLPARAEAERSAVAHRIAGTMFWLGVAAGAGLLLVGSFGNRLLDAVASGTSHVDLRPLVLFAVLPLADLPARLLPNLLVAEGRARSVTLVSVAKSVLTSASILIPVALGSSIWTVAASYVAAGVLYGLALPYFLRALYHGVPRSSCPVTRRQLFAFSIPIGLTDVVSLLNSQFDRYLIMVSFPAAGFATYQAGAWQIPIITYVPYAVGMAYAPRFVELLKRARGREVLALWRASIAKVALLVLPVTAIFMVGAEETMELLFTSAYRDAAPIFRAYAALGLLRVAAYGTLMVSAGKPRYVLLAALFSFASNALLCLPLLYFLGFPGPAVATALALIPTVILYCHFISRALGVEFAAVFPLRAYARVLLVAGLAALCAVAFKLNVTAPPGAKLLGEAVVLCAVFAALGSALGIIRSEDWRYALNWLRLRILVQERH
jgi:O-antigen/teichoic acid export membrane protein